jgi:NAD/NADP transhydrogenase alpha subunit
MLTHEKTLLTFASESIVPQEKLLVKDDKKSFLTIGMPKENGEFEKRVPLTPESVKILTDAGFKVFVEKGVGDSVFYPDLSYSEAGALISDSRQQVWGCDIVIRISPPTAEEASVMRAKTLCCLCFLFRVYRLTHWK